MAPGRKGGSRSGSRNASRRGGRARDKYAADDDDDVESETTASNLPSYSFGGRFLLDPRSEGWVPFEGKGMSSEITAYGFYLIGWVALWACSVGTVATAKEYREAYVKTPKTDISTSQKQMMETADFLWIGQLILGVVIGGAYIVGTLVATYRRVTAETSSWQIHEVDYAPNRRGILQNKRDNLREEAFKSLAKKGSIFYIEFFYVQLMFWTFVGSGSWVAANGWRKKSNKNGRGEWYAMKCTKDTLEFRDQISKMGYVCIAGMVASGFVVAMLWYIWNEWKSARKHFEFAYGDIGEGGDSPAPQVEELDDPQDGTQGVRRGARRPPPRRPPPAARRGGRQPMGRGGGGGSRSGGGGRAALPDYRSRSRSPYDDGDSDDDVPPRGRSQSRSRGRPRRDNRYGDDEYY